MKRRSIHRSAWKELYSISYVDRLIEHFLAGHIETRKVHKDAPSRAKGSQNRARQSNVELTDAVGRSKAVEKPYSGTLMSTWIGFRDPQKVVFGVESGVTSGGRRVSQQAGAVLRPSLLRGLPKFDRKVSKITHLGVASLLAMLLHWVQPLPTGAWGREYKRCTSYRSNTNQR